MSSVKSGLPQLMVGFHSGRGANYRAGLFTVSETDNFLGPKILVLAESVLLLILLRAAVSVPCSIQILQSSKCKDLLVGF